jgi:tetratricopeptide (TPR) repeat protein
LATVGASGSTYYHQASDSYFSVRQRDDGKFYQRRHQLDASGGERNVLERSIDFVMGSGNHARTFLHRTARNTLVELPLGWYADKGGYYAMNPGYDRADHEGFRRKIGYDCMFCHNGYPRIPAGHDKPFAEPVYLDPLPQGIDCQRCHGPGAKHVTLAGTAGAKKADIRAAIVNPKRLSPERREEVCIQCHLESTSFPLPNSLARYDRGPFAYKPGEPLSASWLFFDHAPGTARDDKFEIVNAVYRMRKSKCFVESKGALECGSCHNPHDVPRGDEARRHYDAACRNCHSAAEKHPLVAALSESGCADCHMPKRRTEDVVHAVATDHMIQRHKPAGDLLAARQERHETGDSAYRGEVVLHYPEKLPPTPDNELYVALAQVVDKSNLNGGIQRLQAAIARHPQARAEFYIGLAEALQASGQPAKALPLYREAVRRNPRSVFALQKLGLALRHSGALVEAVAVLKRANAVDQADVINWHELGLTYREQGRTADAIAAFEKAIALDPDVPEPHSNLGSVLLAAGDQARAESAFREAIRIQPDYADAHDNLGTLVAAKGEFAQARDHFETALRLRPRDARTRYNFAMALGRAQQFDEAQQQLEEAVRVDKEFLEARLVLGDLLTAKEQASAALPHYREAVRIDPESGRARLGLGTALALTGDQRGAVEQLRKAATAADAQVRESAAALLQELGVR